VYFSHTYIYTSILTIYQVHQTKTKKRAIFQALFFFSYQLILDYKSIITATVPAAEVVAVSLARAIPKL